MCWEEPGHLPGQTGDTKCQTQSSVILHQQNDHYLCTLWLLSKYSLTTLWLFSNYSLTTHWLSPDYSLTTLYLLPDYSLTTPWLLSDYSLTALWLPPDHSLTTLFLLSAYFLTVLLVILFYLLHRDTAVQFSNLYPPSYLILPSFERLESWEAKEPLKGRECESVRCRD